MVRGEGRLCVAKSRKPSPEVPAARLLGAVADALSACGAAGLPVKLRHGAVMTPAGYVLEADGGRWVARTLAWTEFSTLGEGDD
jgi:hypothetical protein